MTDEDRAGGGGWGGAAEWRGSRQPIFGSGSNLRLTSKFHGIARFGSGSGPEPAPPPLFDDGKSQYEIKRGG